MRCLLAFFLISFNAQALDVVRINKNDARGEVQARYKVDVVKQALQLTEKSYGPYKIITQGPPTTIERAILEVKSGKTINTFFAVSTNKWEEFTLPIRIPIRRGILNYRLLVTSKNKVDTFKTLKSLDELKALKVGVKAGWATTTLLKENGFNVVEANSYEGLFYMLSSGRVDYIPRGINEVYDELERLSAELPDLVVAPNIALYTPTPFYIFLSPHEKILAERLTIGLELMIKNKMLKQIFDRHYAQNIHQSDLANRIIFKIPNSNLPVQTPLERHELWFEYD